MKVMRKIRMLRPLLRLFCLTGFFLVLAACDGRHDTAQSPRPPTQPGMHVYKDPVSGKFVAQPPPSDSLAPQVLPRALQRINRSTGTESASKSAQEYKSSTKGGGILLDLPAPYSDVQK